MAATEEQLEGAELADGRWRLRSLIGQGGMASVWLATDTRLERPVAVKLLNPALAAEAGYSERLLREAQLAAGLSHPNLVAVFDYGAGPPRPFVVLEYVPGGTLADRLRSDRVPPAEPLARQLLDALAHVHAAGIVHRDVKPANVLIDPSGRARLTDFGIARPSAASDLTATGLVVGTLRYIAPEVGAGEPSTARSDLYALGVLLREITGEAGPRGLRRLADRLAAEDPADRPSSAQAALALLDSAAAPAPGAALRRLGPRIERRGNEVRIRLTPPALAGVAALLILVVLGLGLALQAGGDTVHSPPALRHPGPGAPLATQLDALRAGVQRLP